MTYFKGTFPDAPSKNLEERLSTACLGSIDYYNGEDSLEKTIKIFRTTEKESEKGRGIQKYIVLTIFADGRPSVPELYDSCPYHKEQAKKGLAKYLPNEIIQAEFQEFSKNIKNLPSSVSGSYSNDGKTYITYHFPDGTMRQEENSVKPYSPLSIDEALGNKDYPGAPIHFSDKESQQRVVESMFQSREASHKLSLEKENFIVCPPKTIPEETAKIPQIEIIEPYSGNLSNKCPTKEIPKDSGADED